MNRTGFDGKDPGEQQRGDERDLDDPRYGILAQLHACTWPASRAMRMSATVWRISSRSKANRSLRMSLKRGSSMKSGERGCGSFTSMIDLMRPGRAVITTMRSARNTA